MPKRVMCDATEEPLPMDVSAELYPTRQEGEDLLSEGLQNRLDRTHQLLKGYHAAGLFMFSFFCINDFFMALCFGAS